MFYKHYIKIFLLKSGPQKTINNQQLKLCALNTKYLKMKPTRCTNFSNLFLE